MLKTIRDRLIEIEKTIPTLRTVAPRVPQAVQQYELPAVFNLPTALQLLEAYDTYISWQSVWRIECVVAQVNLNLRAENEDAVLDTMDALLDRFAKSPRLELNGLSLSGVTSARVQSANVVVTGYPAGSQELLWYVVQLSMTIEYVETRC